MVLVVKRLVAIAGIRLNLFRGNGVILMDRAGVPEWQMNKEQFGSFLWLGFTQMTLV